MHFAALALVAESVEHPERYYRSNVVGTLNLLDAMRETGVERLVFSSTCAVYGEPETVPMRRGRSPTAPVNSYGDSKLAVDRMIADECRAHGLAAASLRYFNVAGAQRAARRGPRARDAPDPARAAGRRRLREHVKIFGTDYPTRDGTAVRDYIHVEDLGRAHTLALAARRARPARDLQPRHRPRLLGPRGRRRRPARDRPRDPGRSRSRAGRATRPRSSPPARDPRRARLGAARSDLDDDDRRRLGLAPGPPGRLRGLKRGRARRPSTAVRRLRRRRAPRSAPARRRRARRRRRAMAAKNAPSSRSSRSRLAARRSARPAAGSIRSSSVRSGVRPPVANSFIARIASTPSPRPAPW